MDAAALDRIRTNAREFDLAKALLTLLLVPFVALGWVVAKTWRGVELAVGLVAGAFKEGWHTARGDR